MICINDDLMPLCRHSDFEFIVAPLSSLLTMTVPLCEDSPPLSRGGP